MVPDAGSSTARRRRCFSPCSALFSPVFPFYATLLHGSLEAFGFVVLSVVDGFARRRCYQAKALWILSLTCNPLQPLLTTSVSDLLLTTCVWGSILILVVWTETVSLRPYRWVQGTHLFSLSALFYCPDFRCRSDHRCLWGFTSITARKFWRLGTPTANTSCSCTHWRLLILFKLVRLHWPEAQLCFG